MATNTTSPQRTTIPFVQGLFIGALAIRCVWLGLLVKTPFWSTLLVDALTYHEYAQKLLADHFVPAGVFERTPLYPYLLAVVYGLLQPDPLWARLLQITIGSFNVVLLYRITVKLFDEMTGRIAGVIAAGYGMFWVHEADLLAPVWVIFFLLMAMHVLLPKRERTTATTSQVVAGGVLTGFAGLAWPTALFALPGIAALSITGVKERIARYKRIGLVAGIAVGCSLLIVVYQAVRFGEPLLSKQSGVNLYIGNNPEADGYSAIVPGYGPAWTFEELKYQLEKKEQHPVSWSELDRHYSGMVREFWFEHPIRAIGLTLRKLGLVVYAEEIPNTFDLTGFARSYRWPYAAFLVGWWWVLPLGVASVLVLRNRQTQLLWWSIGGLTIGVVLVFVNSRYRLPIAPFLIMLSAVTVRQLYLRRKELKMVALAGVVIVAAGAATQVNWGNFQHDGGSFGMMQLSVAFRDNREYDKAEQAFRNALDAAPMMPGARTELALLLLKKNQTDEARELAEEEIRVCSDPRQSVNVAAVFANVGTIFTQLREYQRAEFCFEEALRRYPNLEEAIRNRWRSRMMRAVQAYLAHDPATAESLFQSVAQEARGQQMGQLADQFLAAMKADSLDAMIPEEMRER